MTDRALPLAPGDFVRIVHGEYESEFGYVLRRTEGIYSIAVDQCCRVVSPSPTPYTAWPPLPVIDCTLDDLQLVRGHETFIKLEVQDFVHQSFPVHGVAASTWASASENISMDFESALGRLHRPTIAELAPPHTIDSVFADLDVKELYFRIFRGEYRIEWSHKFPVDETIRFGSPMVVIFLAVKLSGDYWDTVHAFSYNPTINGSHLLCCPTDLQFPGLSEHQNNALSWRVVHHLLRLTGVDIGLRIRSFLAETMSLSYQSKSWWKEALDMAIIKADIAVMSRDSSNELSTNLYHLARALMACDRLLLAADIFQQASEATAVFSDVVKSIYCKAKALRLAGCFDEAEHCLFNIFRLTLAEYRGNLIHESAFEDLIVSIHDIYTCRDVLTAEPLTAVMPGQSWTLLHKVNFILLALGAVACKEKRVDISICPLGKKYRRVNAAKKALLAAFQSAAAQKTCESSTEAFRKEILSASQRGYCFELVVVDPSIVSKFANISQTWKTEEQRAQLEEGQRAVPVPCGNSDCKCRSLSINTRLDKCSKCQDIYYCSRECQVAHWPEHRSRCKLVAQAIASACATK